MKKAMIIPLRFQRQELQRTAALSDVGKACLAHASCPQDLLTTLTAAGAHLDALAAMAWMLPHREAVWWACLAVRLLPGLTDCLPERAAVEAAECWVHDPKSEHAERALAASGLCAIDAPATYVALAAYWCGPSLAPRGQQAVSPPPHLVGAGAHAALLLMLTDRAIIGRIDPLDLLSIGIALMHGDTGRSAQAAIRSRLHAG